MPRLPADKIAQRAHDVAVLCDHHAAVDPVTETVPGGFSHLPGGFSGGDQQNPAGEDHTL